MSQTDKDLVKRACQGDTQALGLLVDRHSSGLYRMAMSLVGKPDDAQDLVQDTWLGALKNLSQFQGRASVRTWLTRILMKQAAGRWRYRSYRKTQSLDSSDMVAQNDSRLFSADSVVQSDARLDLQALLQGISVEHRVVLILRELEGLSYDQIAQALDLPRGTIESRLFRARQALKSVAGTWVAKELPESEKDEVKRV